MLCQFTFKNFKSYKAETVFDMQAVNINEFNDSLITFDKDKKKLLPLSVIYGPNGGGKSNVLEALATLLAIVLKPIILMKNNLDIQKQGRSIMVASFKFDRKVEETPTEFEIYFRESSDEFRYNLIIQKNKIKEEYLYRVAIGGKKPAMIFARYEGNIELGSDLKKAKVSVDVNESMTYLSFLGLTYNIIVIKRVINWFDRSNYLDYSNPLDEIASKMNPYLSRVDIRMQMIKMLNGMDVNISDISLGNDDEIYTKRNIKGNNITLKLDEESQGTIKLIGLLPHILVALSQGQLIIIDELDAKLHPKLLRYIIRLFTDKSINEKGAQIIFTSHDLSSMKSDLLRRDEIWFAAKDNEDASRIYSLYDLRDERNDHIKTTAAYDKQYLEGRYGADPYLSSMLHWEV